MSSRDRVLAALRCDEPDQVPFADWIDAGIRRRLAAALGNAEMDDACFARELGLDALCFADDRYMAPAFCLKAVAADGKVHLGEGLIRSSADLRRFSLPDLRAPDHFDAAKRYLDRYAGEDLAIWCSLRGGMMNTIYSLGMMRFCSALRSERSLVETLFASYIDWNTELVGILQELGFDFFVTYDDVAYNSGPFFSPKVFRELFVPGLRRLAAAMRLPWVFHSDGDLGPLFDDIVELGCAGYNPFQPPVMDIESYHDRYAGRFCFWGNIDITTTLTHGSVKDVDDEVRRRIARLAPGGGYILASSNSITDHCRVENVLAMLAAKQKYGRYPIMPALVRDTEVSEQ